MESKKYSLTFGGEELTFEFGRMAEQANGAVLARWGDAMVLATAVMSDKNREGIDFFPLSVDFEERLYAAGFIKHSRFMKREGRPTDEAVLTSRMIDRALRPRFDHSLRREIQVMITALAVDDKVNIDILAMNAASMALLVSDIPWAGPIGAIRVGLNNENAWTFSPGHKEQSENLGNLVVAGVEDKINMIETEGLEIKEEKILEGVTMIMPEIEKMMAWQKQIASEIGLEKKKDLVRTLDPEVVKLTQGFLKGKLEASLFGKKEGGLEEVKSGLFELINEKFGGTAASELEKAKSDSLAVFEEELNNFAHQLALKEKKRVDGRKFDEVREITCEVDVLSRAHGSAIFKRGLTQALSVVTLGAPGDEQLLDGMETIDEKKRYFHHYNFPPYSTGEVKRLNSPGRREIGHGYIAEKAIRRLLPVKEDFPYTIRVVSEILSSNGSSSMAATCGSALSLMAAGVPLKKPVAGIAMGLMMEGQDYEILTDIQGPEDHYGDMDLKVAGTNEGITAIQMDVKIDGVTLEMLKKALAQGKQAREFILGKIAEVIPAARKELSTWAPRIYTLQINPDKIRDVIGPGGKVINAIIKETGVSIDVEDTGFISITSKSDESAQVAKKWIENLTHEVTAGEIFQGKITRILTFGAFAEILPGQEGLIHISELADHRVEKVEDVVKVGDVVPVKVKEIDDQGRINLSLKALNNNGGTKQPESKDDRRGPSSGRRGGGFVGRGR